MLKLTLFRHGRAADTDEGGDFLRQLTAFGISQVQKTAERLMANGHRPDFLITSSAMRAEQTCRAAADVWGISEDKILKDKSLYDGLSAGELLFLVDAAAADQNVCCFGHNPGWTELASIFSQGEAAGLNTADAAVCRWEESAWKDVEPHSGRLVFFTGAVSLNR